MRIDLRVLSVAMIAILLFAGTAFGKMPGKGDTFPDVELEVPKDAGSVEYLGLEEAEGTFRISDIGSNFVLVQFFSVYCPHCQKEAPDMNEFRNRIGEQGLGDKLKIICVGAGNNAFEVKVFREKYDMTLPLFTDAEFVLYDAVGKPGTPSYFLVKNRRGEPPVVVYSKAGRFFDIDAFLKELRQAAGL